MELQRTTIHWSIHVKFPLLRKALGLRMLCNM